MGFQNFFGEPAAPVDTAGARVPKRPAKAPPDVHIPGTDILDVVRIRPRGIQTVYAAGASDGRDGGESQGILWIILVLIDIGVVIWVLFTVIIAVDTWWAGLFRSEEVEDWEAGKREE